MPYRQKAAGGGKERRASACNGAWHGDMAISIMARQNIVAYGVAKNSKWRHGALMA